MKKEIIDQWVKELRDPKYLEHNGIYFLWQLSISSTERRNAEGVLYEVLKKQPDYELLFGQRVEESSRFVSIPAAPPRYHINARARILNLDGEHKEEADSQLPTALLEYAGFTAANDILLAGVRAYTQQNKPFAEIADFIQANC